MWKRLLLHDPWQKLGALLLAGGIWYVAFRHTTATRTYDLPVRPAPEGLPPAAVAGEVRVAVPEGFVLDDPPVVRIRLRGTQRDFLLVPTVSGVFDPTRTLEGGAAEFRGGSFRVEADDIRWSPQVVEDLLDGMEPETLRLDFERLERRPFGLGPRCLSMSGEPAEGFVAEPGRARFAPGTVWLRGRARSLEGISRGEDLRLEPFLLAGENATVVRMLGLHASLAEGGLSMEPRAVMVSLPVEPRPTEVRFRGKIEVVAFGPGAAERAAGFRLRAEDAERDFLLTFRGSPPVPHLDSEEAAALVHLFVDLGEIPAEALARGETRFELPLHESLRVPPEAARATALAVTDPSGRRTAGVERVTAFRPPGDGR